MLRVLASSLVVQLLAVGVCLAADSDEARPLRVLSYNIHHGEGTDGQLDLERIARVIKSVKPDIVALQEVDQLVPRSGSVDQPATLGRLLQMEVAFGKNLDLDGGAYGNAVLSRFPISSSKNHLLPRLNDGEQRGVLEVEVTVPWIERPLRVLGTHLDHRRPDTERLASIETIQSVIASQAGQPALLIGDLNDVPGSRVLRQLDRSWTRPQQAEFATSPSVDPKRQIDFILYRPGDHWELLEMKVLEEPIASDHRPLFAILELKQPGNTCSERR